MFLPVQNKFNLSNYLVWSRKVLAQSALSQIRHMGHGIRKEDLWKGLGTKSQTESCFNLLTCVDKVIRILLSPFSRQRKVFYDLWSELSLPLMTPSIMLTQMRRDPVTASRSQQSRGGLKSSTQCTPRMDLIKSNPSKQLVNVWPQFDF